MKKKPKQFDPQAFIEYPQDEQNWGTPEEELGAFKNFPPNAPVSMGHLLRAFNRIMELENKVVNLESRLTDMEHDIGYRLEEHIRTTRPGYDPMEE
jgi:hypothetical protein